MTLAATALVMASCGGNVEYADTVNGVYHWKSSFWFKEYEQAFMSENKIGKMYLHFFDVDKYDYEETDEKFGPKSTLDINNDLPDSVEIVPTIFITPSAIKNYREYYKFLARRIYAMCDYNDIHPKEIQFDCDWTTSTRDSFYCFLKTIRGELGNYFPKIRLSSTIRLHQLSQTPPPVEEGVLMCYNTGDFKDFDTKNSILDIKDIKPYMKYLKKYDLPLSLALPIYEWDVEFDTNRNFIELDNYCYISENYSKIDSNLFLYHYEFGPTVYVRHEHVAAATLLEAKDMVQQAYGKKMNIILYHLDERHLKKYTKNEIEEIYR